MSKSLISTISYTDVKTRDSADAALSGTSEKNIIARLLPFIGPAFIASVAYVDPGNFATNIQAGSEFGYTLLWVVLVSNLMAMLIQSLSAKLGIATGANLAEHCRKNYKPAVTLGMWVMMELVAMATDLAEFLGAALGFQLLLGLPLMYGGALTAICTFLILGLQRYGFRPLEIVITLMVSIIAVSYLAETLIIKPDLGALVMHSFVPQFSGTESVLLATGILGATVMPHAIFLHSSLTQDRIVVKEPNKLRRLFRFEILDVTIAMGIASLVNMAMLMMAAVAFYRHGLTHVATIQDAHATLQPLLGKAAGWIFAVSLLASGLSSSTVGTSAGQVIMQGFLHRHIPVWLRRLLTMVPSIGVIALGLDPTRTLVISQVILSFGLPFAIIPLIMFTKDRKVMGNLVNKKLTTYAVSLVAVMIISLNFYLIFQVILG